MKLIASLGRTGTHLMFWLILILMCGISFAEQSPSFKCPDPEAKKACDSFWELKEADDQIVNAGNFVQYVCFRQEIDEFFIVEFRQPAPQEKKFDSEGKPMVLSEEKSFLGIGSLKTVKNGIEDQSSIPTFDLLGAWTYSRIIVLPPKFKSLKDKEKISKLTDGRLSLTSDSLPKAVVEIDNSQFRVVDYEYQNSSDETVHYNLVIQRSTGRYTEKFLKEGEKLPFISRSGRCLIQP